MVPSLARAKNNNIGQNKLTGNSTEICEDFRKRKIVDLFWKGDTSVQNLVCLVHLYENMSEFRLFWKP